MKALHRKFAIQLLIISIAAYGIAYFLFSRWAVDTLPIIIMVPLLFTVNILAFILVTNTKEKNPRGFVFSYMAVTFGRLIICSIFVFSYALTHRHDARVFALTFFILYFIYNIVEVKALYGFFKS